MNPSLMEQEPMEIIRALLADGSGQDADFYLRKVSLRQKAGLAQAAQVTLNAEVVLLRTAMKSFYQSVHTDEDDNHLNRLAKALNLLGLSCTRLANVIKINQTLQGTQPSAWEQDIQAEMDALLAEWEQAQGVGDGR